MKLGSDVSKHTNLQQTSAEPRASDFSQLFLNALEKSDVVFGCN
jgi:hypothetical protein